MTPIQVPALTAGLPELRLCRFMAGNCMSARNSEIQAASADAGINWLIWARAACVLDQALAVPRGRALGAGQRSWAFEVSSGFFFLSASITKINWRKSDHFDSSSSGMAVSTRQGLGAVLLPLGQATAV